MSNVILVPTLTALKSRSDPVSHKKVPLLRLPSLRSENVEKEHNSAPLCSLQYPKMSAK